MNINKKLKKIGRNLQEITMAINMPDKPQDRKGDYIYIRDPMSRKRFIAQLDSNPKIFKNRYYKAYFIAPARFDKGPWQRSPAGSDFGGSFWKYECKWQKGKWHLIEGGWTKAHITITPKEWNPPSNMKNELPMYEPSKNPRKDKRSMFVI